MSGAGAKLNKAGILGLLSFGLLHSGFVSLIF
jgi:hypothetical protein